VEGYDKYKLHITVAVEVIVEETACFDSKPFLLQYQQVIEGHTHTHPFNGPLSGTTWVQKVKPVWILLKQKTVSGSGISCAIRNSAPRSRQITTPAPHHSVFTGQICDRRTDRQKVFSSITLGMLPISQNFCRATKNLLFHKQNI